MTLHRHIVEAHDGIFEERDEGLAFACPECGKESVIEPNTTPDDTDPVEQFGRDFRTLAIDALLDHLETEHGWAD